MSQCKSELIRMNNRLDKVQSLVLNALSESYPSSLYEPMREYPRRKGKGFRITLCLTVCKAYGCNPFNARYAAGAIELFENYALVHDDIEDQSLMRRGEPALHIKYGVPLAINAGDGLLMKAWEMVLRNRTIVGDSRTLKLFKEFGQICLKAAEGQSIELEWISKGVWNITKEDYLEMIKRKTAWYTCIGPCRMGAIVAGANDKELSKLTDFAAPLGIAFQLQDDVLDLSQTEEVSGKEPAEDLYEGKRTLMIIRLFELCNGDERKRIVDILKKPRESKVTNDVNYLLKLIERYDCVSYAKKAIQKLSVRSRGALERLSLVDRESRTELEHVVDFVVGRDK